MLSPQHQAQTPNQSGVGKRKENFARPLFFLCGNCAPPLGPGSNCKTKFGSFEGEEKASDFTVFYPAEERKRAATRRITFNKWKIFVQSRARGKCERYQRWHFFSLSPPVPLVLFCLLRVSLLMLLSVNKQRKQKKCVKSMAKSYDTIDTRNDWNCGDKIYIYSPQAPLDCDSDFNLKFVKQTILLIMFFVLDFGDNFPIQMDSMDKIKFKIHHQSHGD